MLPLSYGSTITCQGPSRLTPVRASANASAVGAGPGDAARATAPTVAIAAAVDSASRARPWIIAGTLLRIGRRAEGSAGEGARRCDSSEGSDQIADPSPRPSPASRGEGE